MAKVFRRPMFRGGSTNMNGIMSGIQDRENYAGGSFDAQNKYRDEMSKSVQSGIDPLSKLLISGGMNAFSENRGGGTLANLGLAFKDPTERLFSDLENRDQTDRENLLKGLGFDADNERTTNKRLQALADMKSKQEHEENLFSREMEIKQQLAQDKADLQTTLKGSELENKIEVKIQEGENKLAELKYKKNNPAAAGMQVTPAFENVVSNNASMFENSKNPAVKAAPHQTAINITKFTREADPKIQSKYKGFKPYTYNTKNGELMELPTTRFSAGDIIYDAYNSDFLVFDNTGGTYKLNPLTYDIEE